MATGIIIKADRDREVLAAYAEGEWVEKLEPALPLAYAAELFQDGKAYAFAWDEKIVGVLTELGVPRGGWSLFHRDYTQHKVEGSFDPMPHQLETAAFLTENKRAYCTSTMRTGKTASVVLALDYLEDQGVKGAALIVCPVSVMERVWARCIRHTLWTPRTVVVRGAAAKRRELLEEGNARYYIMNYDALKHLEKPLSKMIANGRITKVVIDELSHYGNTRTARWKAADGLFNPRSGRAPEYVWALTGTPGADVMAVYGFANLVNPKAMPWKTYDGWQVSLRYKWGRENWQWRDRASAPETVRQVLQPNIRYNKEDVLKDLPPVTRTRLEAELTDEQSDMFATLKLEMTALTAGGEKVKADRKAALISKLFQVAAGGVITDSGLSAVDASPRNEMILGLVRDNPRKTVIFCAFRGVVDLLAEYLTKNDVPTVKVHGDVTGRTRDKAFESFQNSDKYKAMVAHPVTTAYGTELSAADQLIINGPLLSGSHTYMQGLERLSSSRQKSDRVSIVEVVASKEEAMFFNTLDYRVGQADAVSRLFEYITQGGAIHGRSKRSLQRA